MPRHHRLLVAGFAFDFTAPPRYVGGVAAMRRAHALYERFDPFGYDAPYCNAGDFRNSKLTVEGIMAELDELAARE